MQAALDTKHGVIFLTPHLGCFEIIAQAVAAQTRLTALYRPPRKAALKPLIEGARARHNLVLAPANLSGVRSLAKALKKGEAPAVSDDRMRTIRLILRLEFAGVILIILCAALMARGIGTFG